MSAVIAERELKCDGRLTLIRIYEPQPDQADWRCDYEISWPSAPRRSYAMGVDSFQALQLAMFKIATDVSVSDDFKAGRVALFGEPMTTLDQLHQIFPVPWKYK
jgi:hypothetical protein